MERSHRYTVADKVIIPRSRLWIAYAATLVAGAILGIAAYQTRASFNLGDGVVTAFRVLSFVGIGTTLIINILLYFPVSTSEWNTIALTDETATRLYALRFGTLIFAVLCCYFALITVATPLLHLSCVSATFFTFYVFDLTAARILASDPAGEPLLDSVRASLTFFSRPILRAHTLFLITITAVVLTSRDTGSHDTVLIVDSFVTGMISFSLLVTTLTFLEYNWPEWTQATRTDSQVNTEVSEQ